MTIRMDEGAAELLDTLHRAGYAAYVVGGCVRDSLLGLTPHDWDLCTSALPQQVMELFGAQRCIPTGLQHGTITVKQSGALYEITTFRTEGTYTDGRHPDEVHFVPDVACDLKKGDDLEEWLGKGFSTIHANARLVAELEGGTAAHAHVVGPGG